MNKVSTILKTRSISPFYKQSLRCLSSSNLPSYLSKYSPVEVTTLPNGMRVATQTGYDNSCAVALGIGVGSRVETIANNGVAHFLEHLSFKGTDKRTKYELETSIENRGAKFNAYTGRDLTCYYFQILKNDVNYATEFISDVIFHSKYMEHSIEEERDVILLESESIFDNKYEFLFDILHSTAFPESGLGLTILGSEHNIKTITRKDVTSFISKYYTGSNLILSGAGGLEHQQLVDAASKYFDCVQPTPQEEQIRIPAKFVADRQVYMDTNYPVAHIALANQGVGWKDSDSFAIMLLHTIIDQYDASNISAQNPLSKDVAQKHLCNNLSNINIFYKETGLFGVYYECAEENVEQATETILKSYYNLKNTITPEHLDLAKKRFIFNILSNLDTTVSKVEDITRHLLYYGRCLTPAEIIARTNLVTIDHIYNIIDKYIINKPLTAVAYGPVQKFQSKEWFKHFTNQ